jgi:sulfane dehydrogenase subunit SoxC
VRARVPADPTKIQGAGSTPVGTRSPFERPVRTGRGTSSQTPLQDLTGIITPADLHFERHHAGVPAIDPERYSLLVHGLVERPMVFTLADLKRFPGRSIIRFLECSGNGGRAYRSVAEDAEVTPQQVDGLTSTSEWTGVPLATLFREVGASPRARWFLAEAMDAAVMTRSIPIEKAYDDALIAYAQNGEALRPEQGYPARLLLPGFEGSSNVKWIRRLELADGPFMTREETSKYTDPLPDGTARMFSFVMDAKSIITEPAWPNRLTGPGWWEIRGLAWSGRGRITRVEVSADGGRTWQTATLDEPILPKCHTRFRLPWRWSGGDALLMSRAADETGYMQPTRDALVKARGPSTSYHYNNIRAWRVGTDGSVRLAGSRA